MTKCLPIIIASEDQLLAALGERLLLEVKGFHVCNRLIAGGEGELKKYLPNCLGMSHSGLSVLYMTDLDRRECAPDKVKDWMGGISSPELFLFRIAVREAESWLLADDKGIAKFFNISVAHLPRDSEGLSDPKQMLINLAGNSRLRVVREGIPPQVGGTATVGPEYNYLLKNFVSQQWDVQHALSRSDSLKRAWVRITQLRENSIVN